MAATTGNQFWKLRGKHGRERIVKDPVKLAENADEYFQWCVDHPIYITDFVGKDAIEVKRPNPYVFQKDEFARFCGCADWRPIEALKEVSEDFLQVVTRIEGIIRDQKYRYAVIGVFSSNIIARDLGLADKRDISAQVNDLRKSVDELFPPTSEIIGEEEEPDGEADK